MATAHFFYRGIAHCVRERGEPRPGAQCRKATRAGGSISNGSGAGATLPTTVYREPSAGGSWRRCRPVPGLRHRPSVRESCTRRHSTSRGCSGGRQSSSGGHRGVADVRSHFWNCPCTGKTKRAAARSGGESRLSESPVAPGPAGGTGMDGSCLAGRCLVVRAQPAQPAVRTAGDQRLERRHRGIHSGAAKVLAGSATSGIL